MRKSTELAFLIGLILGDGNISKFPRVECLRITLGTDKPNLAKYSVKIIEKLFCKAPSIIKRSNSNCFNVTLYQRNISHRLEIPIGARGKLDITLPNWCVNNKKYLISILKGLFEAEASYCVHLRTCTYNFEFSNRNTSLLNKVEKSLRHLGYSPERRTYAIRLRKRNEVESFKKMIDFRSYL
ncbi:hypothetical protein GW844_03320 [bacterium]|nr:hypothetical protein [bacterium]